MRGMFGEDPLVVLMTIRLAVLAVVVFALMTARF